MAGHDRERYGTGQYYYALRPESRCWCLSSLATPSTLASGAERRAAGGGMVRSDSGQALHDRLILAFSP